MVYFMVNLLVELFQIGINTVQETDTQSNSAHIQVFLGDHLIGLCHFK